MDTPEPRARLYYLFRATNMPQGTPWLARVPAGIFAISVGLFGLVDAWQRAAASGWRVADIVASILVWPAILIWVASLLLYAIKCKRHWRAVAAEFRHPVQGSLQALLPLSMLLAIIQFRQPEQGIWLLLALCALALNAVIAFRVASVLITGQMPANAVTPALYLPIVGGALIGAMTFASLGYRGWAALLFGTGLSGWALLEARILSQLSHGPLPETVRATIGVELVPPVIATLAAAVIWPDLPADILLVGLGIAAVPFATVALRFRWWSKVPFSIGFWSFSFPLAALAGSVLEAVHRGGWPMWIGYATLLAASAVITLLAVRTVILAVKGKLLPAQ
ncbi:SLAC1 family transporter [Noviherbaspirillum agri]